MPANMPANMPAKEQTLCFELQKVTSMSTLTSITRSDSDKALNRNQSETGGLVGLLKIKSMLKIYSQQTQIIQID